MIKYERICVNLASFNVLDTDYVNEKYNGKKNNRLEDISDEEKIIDHEEIIPMMDEKNN